MGLNLSLNILTPTSVVYQKPVFKILVKYYTFDLHFINQETCFVYVFLETVGSSSGFAGLCVTLRSRADAALIDWIPINSRLSVIRSKWEERCLS